MLGIYLTDLSAYNHSPLVKRWIKLPISDIKLIDELTWVLKEGKTIIFGSNHEKDFITDYEWKGLEFFTINEYTNIFDLSNKQNLCNEVDTNILKGIKFILDENVTDDIQDAIIKAENVIIYENVTMEDVSYELIENSYCAKELHLIIGNNIDYSSISRDLEYEDDYHTIDSDVFEYRR